MHTGDHVKELRGLRKMTQKDLAEKAGVTMSTVWRLESGEVTPTLETLQKIAAALDVDPQSLLDGVPPPLPKITKPVATVLRLGLYAPVSEPEVAALCWHKPPLKNTLAVETELLLMRHADGDELLNALTALTKRRR